MAIQRKLSASSPLRKLPSGKHPGLQDFCSLKYTGKHPREKEYFCSQVGSIFLRNLYLEE